MYCPNCGKEISDGSKFCGACGSRIEEMLGKPTKPSTEANQEIQSKDGHSNDASEGIQRLQVVPPKKKSKKKILIALGVAVVAVILAVIGLVSVLSSRDSEGTYMYISGDHYVLLNDLNAGEGIEIASGEEFGNDPRWVTFSPDGKYVYYYTKFDTDAYTGTLCRAEYAKLKKNSNKNDQYIDVIATNVRPGLDFLSDGTLFYRNGDNTLYYYDGESVSQIAKSIAYYHIDETEGRIVYATGSSSDGYDLFGAGLDDLGTPDKLVSNCSRIYSYTDFDNIVYEAEDDNFPYALYVVGFDSAPQKLADSAYVIKAIDDVVYYSTNSGTTLNLYDYVVDDYQTADARVTEPILDDYGTPTYAYQRIDAEDPLESNYSEVYTSCTKGLKWLNGYTMEGALNVNGAWRNSKFVDITDELKSLLQSFINEYKSMENEAGMILVTEDVKTALKNIAALNASENSDDWLLLCYEKIQNGTAYDYDSYYADCDIYYEAESRISLREQLQDSENAYNVEALYYVKDGTPQLICDNVLQYSICAGGILYNTVDMVTDTVNLEEISSIDDVESLFDFDRGECNYLFITDDLTTCQFSQSAAGTYGEAFDAGSAAGVIPLDDAYLSASTGKVFLWEVNGAFSAATISDGTVGSFSYLSDDGYLIRGADQVKKAMDGTVYYTTDNYSEDNLHYGNLYSFFEGNSTLLAPHIIMGKDIDIYSDDVILAYTDYDSASGFELTMFAPDGTATIIAEGVRNYVRVDQNTLLYTSDGDLYVYNDEGRTLLAYDVDYIWSQQTMDMKYSLF